MNNKTNHIKVYILMVIATILWAGAFIAGKLGVYQLSPLILTYWRMLISLIIMFPLMVILKPKTWKIKRIQLKYAITTGITGMLLYHLLFFTAIKYTTVSNSSMINGFNPILTAILAALFLGERLTKKKIFFTFTAFVGVVTIIINWKLSNLISLEFNIGDLIMFSATISMSIYTVIVKKAMKYIEPLVLTTYSILCCVIILTPFAIYEMTQTNIFAVGLEPFLAIIYMAIFPTVIGYTVYQYSIKEIGAGNTSLFINLVPIFSMLFAVLFLQEAFILLNLASTAIIITSVFFFTRSKSSNI